MRNYQVFSGTLANWDLETIQLTGYIRYFADNIRDDYANGALDGQVEGVLEEMKELSIYGP